MNANEVPAGFVLLQRHDGKPLYAACLDGGRFHGWLMSKHHDGHWVSQRKLESWEVMQAEDQRDDSIVHETVAALAAWLTREMPAGTVIGDPAWWAPRILRALAAPVSAGQADRECGDCEGSGRISPAELCARCNGSGVLPGSVGQAD